MRPIWISGNASADQERKEPNKEVVSKLKEFLSYKDGWHYGEGVRFSRRAVHDVFNLCRYSNSIGLLEADVFPGLSGDLQLVIYTEESEYVATRKPDGRWEFSIESGDNEVELSENASFEAVCACIRELTLKRRNQVWRVTSGSSQKNIGTEERGYSGALRFAPLPMAGEFQHSAKIVR